MVQFSTRDQHGSTNWELWKTQGTAHGEELWRSDGSEAGTAMVKDINPGGADSTPDWLTVVNRPLFLSATDGVHGYELWG